MLVIFSKREIKLIRESIEANISEYETYLDKMEEEKKLLKKVNQYCKYFKIKE